MGAVPNRDIENLWLTPAIPTELPFGQGVSAVYNAGRLTDQSFSTHVQLYDDLKNQFQRMRDLGIGAPALPWPLTDRGAEDSLSWVSSQEQAILARRSEGQGPPDPFLKTANELRTGVKERVAAAQAKAALAGTGASLIGGVGVGLTDPINLATLPLGAASGASLLTKVAAEAGLAAFSQLGVEAASAGAKERAGVPVTAAGVAERVATTAIGAAGLVGLFHGLGRVAESSGILDRYRRGVESGAVTPTRETEAAASAIQDNLDTIPPLSSPAAEAAHFEATKAAVDVLRSEHLVLRESAVARLETKSREFVAREADIAAQVAEPAALGRLRGRVEDALAKKADASDRLTQSQTAAARVAGFNPEVRQARATNFAFNTARPGIADALGGVEVRASRINGGVRLEVPIDPMAPSAPRVLSLFDSDGVAGARAKLDAFTEAHGAPTVPAAKIERLAAELDSVRAERIKATRAARDAEIHATRRIGDTIGQPGGVPFKTRREASQYAARAGVGEHVVDPLRRGFVVRPIDRMEVPGSAASVISSRFEALDAVDSAIAKEAESPTPVLVEPLADAPLARPTIEAKDAEIIRKLDESRKSQPDYTMEIDHNGETLSGPMSDIMARLDQEEAELTGTIDCIIGG